MIKTGTIRADVNTCGATLVPGVQKEKLAHPVWLCASVPTCQGRVGIGNVAKIASLRQHRKLEPIHLLVARTTQDGHRTHYPMIKIKRRK